MGAIKGNIGAVEHFYRQWVISSHGVKLKKDASTFIHLRIIFPFGGGRSVQRSPPLYLMRQIHP
jgi:hypothetical protein